MKAVRLPFGKPVAEGDEVVDFRGDKWKFVSPSRANEEGRDGKIIVERDGMRRELYASVFDLAVKP